MAYMMNNRLQSILLPPVIEDYVLADAPVRVYDAFVDSMDFKDLGISLMPSPKGGQDEYYPKDLMKLIIFGYSYGIRSSRKLERACHDNISFIWLIGGLKPDHRTIARFRSTHKKAIRKVLKQCVQLCIKLDLIEGNVLFIDGSKFRADASINNSWTKERCEKFLKKTEEHIDRLIDEAERIDVKEEGQESLVSLKEKVHDKANLMNKIKDVLHDLGSSEQKVLNSTDRDSINVKGRQGTHASYNVQNVVDGKNGLIVHTEVLSRAVDLNQLSRQVQCATAVLEDQPKHVCADSGYSSVRDIKGINEAINVIVPNNKQAQQDNGRHPIAGFNKEEFKYDVVRDEYICPENKRLIYRGNRDRRSQRYYRGDAATCRGCKNFGAGKCTDSKQGREITRLYDQELQDQLEANYKKPENQAIYKLRQQMVEHPFGHMKRNLGAGQFLLRGVENVNAEASILSTCFNISRLMTIVGTLELINILKSI